MDKSALIAKITPDLVRIRSAHEAGWIAEQVLSSGTANPLQAARDIVRRRETGEPLAYIFGQWAFRSYEFAVGSGVLIPRPETEELVDHALNQASVEPGRAFTIVDFGAGSGCIGLSFLADAIDRGKLTAESSARLKLILVEKSPQAIQWLRRNLELMSPYLLDAKVELVEGSWTDWVPEPADVILSNPPYVTNEEFYSVDHSVKDFEPRTSLVPEDISKYPDASGPYREIIEIAKQALVSGGRLWFELGAAQASWILSFVALLDAFDDLSLIADMSRKPRFFSARRNARGGMKHG